MPILFTSTVPLKDTLSNLGLTTNNKLCLDAADPNSYSGGQKWLDVSGGGYDFFLGADATASSTDPLFISKKQGFQFDGGDYFLYDTTPESWMDNIHKDNAVFAILAWIYNPAPSFQGIIGNMTLTTEVGFAFHCGAGVPTFTVVNGSGIACNLSFTSAPITTARWSMVALTLTEATGAGGAIGFCSGATHALTSTYTSPSASAGTNSLAIGAQKAGAAFLPNGARVAMLAMWEATALTVTNLNAIFNATRGRFGV